MEQQLYAAVSSTSSWLDGVENNIFSGSVLLAENTETQIQQQEVQEGLFLQLHITCFHVSIFFNLSQLCNTVLQTLEKDVGHIAEDVKLSQALLAQSCGLGHEDRTLLEDNLDCLKERLGALGCALGQRCDHMRTRAHELTAYQVMLVFLLLECSVLADMYNLFSIKNSEDVHINVL